MEIKANSNAVLNVLKGSRVIQKEILHVAQNDNVLSAFISPRSEATISILLL